VRRPRGSRRIFTFEKELQEIITSKQIKKRQCMPQLLQQKLISTMTIGQSAQNPEFGSVDDVDKDDMDSLIQRYCFLSALY
jgi:hypothetical protein